MTAEIHKKPGLETLRAAISRLEGHSEASHRSGTGAGPAAARLGGGRGVHDAGG